MSDDDFRGDAMSLLKTTCERCGEIELPVERVLLRICESEDSGVCVIRCPECGLRFVKEANDAMIVMLLAVGIEVSMWSTSVHGNRPGQSGRDVAPMPPITKADLDAFRRMLVSEPDIVERLASI